MATNQFYAKLPLSLLRDAHSSPDAVLFFPVVERFAVNLVDGSFCDRHAGRLPRHEEINVVNCAVLSFHIDTGEIFPATEIGKPIVVNPDQIERQIFASIVDVKSFVGGFLASMLGFGGGPAGWIGSIVGAILLLLIYRMVVGRRAP